MNLSVGKIREFVLQNFDDDNRKELQTNIRKIIFCYVIV